MNLQSGKCSQAAGQAAFTCVPEVQSHDRKASNPWTLILKPRAAV